MEYFSPEWTIRLHLQLTLKGCVTYFDNILIFGSTKEECEARTVKCNVAPSILQYLSGLRQMQIFCESHRVPGSFIISHRGLEKDPAKIEAIKNICHTKNADDEVHSFVRMALYYINFIPNG